MLTKERVLGTKWWYGVQQNHVDRQANFEILEVKEDGKLGLYIYSKDDGIDLNSLEDLDLESLEYLVQKRFIRELSKTPDNSRGKKDVETEFLTESTVIGAMVLFPLLGLGTFVAGILAPQKPWEAAIGAAMMIGALLGVAIRRN